MTKVTIYTTPTCVYCKMAKAFFRERDVPYTERDVATDHDAQQEMIKKSGQFGVPVIDVNGQIIVGFDKARLSELLGIH